MSRKSLIPYSRTYTGETAIDYLQEVIETGFVSGEGKFTMVSENLLSKITGSKHSMVTPSCTDALEMASMLIGLKPGDEVILPSFTFPSAAIAVTKFGATPVFVDINSDDLNISNDAILNAITRKTKAVSFVNYAGFGSKIEEIKPALQDKGIYLIEDNAHGLGGKFGKLMLGQIGDFAVHSFHGTKNIQCGEGGSIHFSDDSYLPIAHILRQKGTNRRDFLGGVVDKYSWVGSGSSFLASELQAAVLYSQLQEYDAIQSARNRIWDSYQSGILENEIFQKPSSSVEYSHTSHIYYLLLPDLKRRTEFVSFMHSHEIQVTTHYQPLHNSPAAKKYCVNQVDCPTASKVSETLVRLPIWVGMSQSEINRIIEGVNGFLHTSN